MNSDFQKIFEQEPKYRLIQAKKALYFDLIDDWERATVLPKELRKQLNQKFPIKILGKIFAAKDSCAVKALIKLEDNLVVETVLMQHKGGRNTVCLSCQIGCPLNCLFCATGEKGFKRNLNSWEIVQQVLFFARYLKKFGKKVTNIVFMGMGEPFLNYENVIECIKILNDKNGFNLSARRVSISTAGIIEGIEKLTKEKLQINLAVSLHAPNNKVRSKIMPVNKKYPIENILKAVKKYIKKTRRKVMFEYVLIKEINDFPENAKALSWLMNDYLFFVNLISYNPTGKYEPSCPENVKKFKQILRASGITVTQRYEFGQDIKGACGQLAIIQ